MATDLSPMDDADGYIEKSQAEIFDPPYAAYKLRLAGTTWREVAQRTGYSSAVSCAVAVRAMLQNEAAQSSKERREEALRLELDRLDALQEAYWTAALNGDEKSAQLVLRVSAQRTKLLGIDGDQNSETSGAQKTILITGDNSQYAKALQAVAEGRVTNPEDEDK